MSAVLKATACHGVACPNRATCPEYAAYSSPDMRVIATCVQWDGSRPRYPRPAPRAVVIHLPTVDTEGGSDD